MRHRAKFEKRGLLAMRADLWGMLFEVAEPGEPFELRGDVAIVTIDGPLTHHAEWFWDSYDGIRERFEEACASPAGTVLLRINSPGGDVSGCYETSRALRSMAAAAGKRLVAFADGTAASAAYALACSAEAIYVSETSAVGSIGCICTIVDEVELDKKIGLNFAVISSGARKADGNPHVAISDDARASYQSQVDSLADLFFALVASSRPMGAAAAKALEAGVFFGAHAVQLGLADEVRTFDELLALLASGQASASAAEDSMGWKDAMKQAADAGDADAKKCLDALGADDGGGGGDDGGGSDGGGGGAGADGDAKKSKADDGGGDDDSGGGTGADGDAKKSKADDGGGGDDGSGGGTGASGDDDDVGTKKGKAASRLPKKNATLEQRIAAIEEGQERARLLATRPDLTRDPVMRGKLEAAPLDVVRWQVENAPRAVAPAPKPTQPQRAPSSHLGAITPPATRGKGNGSGDSISKHEASFIDRHMGIQTAGGGVKSERTSLELGFMTPEQARERLKELEGSAKGDR